MDYTTLVTMGLKYLAWAMAAVLVLTGATNLIVQVTKKVVYDKFPTQAWVFGIAAIVTILAFIVAVKAMAIAILWYYWIVVLFMVFIVTYSAMFGYDNLYKYILQGIKKMISNIKELLSVTE